MITLFTTPKPFVGHAAIIQENALRSWSLLGSGTRVVLFGNDAGTAEMAQKLGLEHRPDIAVNEYGTPTLDGLFDQAQRISDHRLFCYVNADILLLSDFVSSVVRAAQRKRRFLMVGLRRDVNINELLSFDSQWESSLRNMALTQGKLQRPTAIDYFVFTRGLYDGLPPFAVGRTAWDNWMIYRARSLRVPVIDATDSVTCIHQNHDYNHTKQAPLTKDGSASARRGYKWVWTGPEARRNFALAGGVSHLYTIWDCTHTLGPDGLKQRDPGKGLGGGIWSYRRSSLYPLAG